MLQKFQSFKTQESASKMDVVLINPPIWREAYGTLDDLASVSPPLGIALIAACCLDDGISCDIIDADAERLDPQQIMRRIVDLNPKIVGVTTMTPTMTTAGNLLTMVADSLPGTLKVAGGIHVSAVPEKTVREEDVDFVIRGDGVVSFPNLCREFLANGKEAVKQVEGVAWLEEDEFRFTPIPRVPDLDSLPMAAWHLLPMDKYRAYQWQGFGTIRNPYAVIYSSVGCPYRCTFCAVNTVHEGRIYYRSPANFVEEIDHLVREYGVRTYWVKDDTFNINRKRVVEICNLLIEREHDLNMFVYARSEGLDDELCELMARAGIKWLFFGVESGNDVMLDKIKKKTTKEKLLASFKTVNKAGLHVGANYLVGFPGDTRETCLETIQFAREVNADCSWFGIVSPYPGTELYAHALTNDVSLPDQWAEYGHYNGSAVEMSGLSGEELVKLRKKGFVDTQLYLPYMAKFLKTFGVRAFVKDFSPRLITSLRA